MDPWRVILMSDRKHPTLRSDYRCMVTMDTRWRDNDSYGHVNNVVYHSYFDSAVNRHLIKSGVLDITNSPVIGFVVENHCTYFSSIGFPDIVHIGLKVIHLGRSSVRYEIALFRNDEERASAVGDFVHVYVDRASNKSTEIPQAVRTVLCELMVEPHSGSRQQEE